MITEAQAAYSAEWRRNNQDKIKAYGKSETHKAGVIKWQLANPEKRKEIVQRWREVHPLRARANSLLQGATRRANERGLPVTIDRPWVEDRLVAGRCALTGLEFDFTPLSPRVPSIDRIEPALGYTPDNCRVIISAANLAKGRWSDADLYEWAEALLAHRLHLSADKETEH